MKSVPRVSFGLPIFNGENYVEDAIESVLMQTYTDFELIISDNASTDQTQTICSRAAALDSRIRYYRNNQNLGASINFNRVFELSKGEFFNWIAHDDLISAKYLEMSVASMDENPSAVLCYPRATIIDSNGDAIKNYDFKLDTDSHEPVLRFRELLKGHKCFEVFGLIRANELRRTRVIGNYGHADGVLLARLALIGPFQEITEHLFFPRIHPGQSMKVYGVYSNWLPDYHAYTEWFDPAKSRRIIFPNWRILIEYVRAVRESDISIRQKFACWKLLLIEWVRIRKRVLAMDIVLAAKAVWNKVWRRDSDSLRQPKSRAYED